MKSGKLEQFKHNPQRFLDQITSVLNAAKNLSSWSTGVKYETVPDHRPTSDRWYSQTMFTEDELAGYVGEAGNIIVGDDGEPRVFGKSVFELLVVDSPVEAAFAKQLQQQAEVNSS